MALTQKHASIDNLTVNVTNKVNSTVIPLGTDGNQNINTPAGIVNFAPGAQSLTVTSSICTANSIVIAVVRTNDLNASIFSVVPSAGSFTINLSAPAVVESSVGFVIYN